MDPERPHTQIRLLEASDMIALIIYERWYVCSPRLIVLHARSRVKSLGRVRPRRFASNLFDAMGHDNEIRPLDISKPLQTDDAPGSFVYVRARPFHLLRI
jgi:hypothetical protein